jgi:1-acyl-sn-glycerol-3-phosphate acyltransferase
MSRSESIITHARGIIIFTPWLLSLLLADVALSVLLPLRALMPNLVYDASSLVAGGIWRWIQLIFEKVNGAKISFSGDPLPKGESAIVVANHLSWSDFYMIQALALRAGMLGRCRYFAKIQLRLVPFLGWGLWAMGMPMVSRNWSRDKQELNKVFSGIVKRRWPTC